VLMFSFPLLLCALMLGVQPGEQDFAPGIVLRTTPTEGAVVRRGTTVLLVVSVMASEVPDTGPSDTAPPSTLPKSRVGPRRSS